MNIQQKNELNIAYLQTRYSIDLPENKIWISPLANNSDLSSFLAGKKVKYWALVTPFNPGSTFLTHNENELRLNRFEQEDLLQLKESRNIEYYPSISRPTDPELEGEVGFFVANIFPWEAVRLGHKWGQNAILVGKSDGFAELQWCYHESQFYNSESGS